MEKFGQGCALPRFGLLSRGVLAENELASMLAVMSRTLELSDELKLKEL